MEYLVGIGVLAFIFLLVRYDLKYPKENSQLKGNIIGAILVGIILILLLKSHLF